MKTNINLQVLPIDQIKANPWNPNRQTDFIFVREMESIKTHGFIDPILVRQMDGFVEIIDGEHRLRGATQLGFTELTVNNLGSVPDEVAKQLTIIMNETRGEADSHKLAELIHSLSGTISLEDLQKALPYTLDQLEHMVAEVKVNWDDIKPEMPKDEPSEEPEEGFTIFQVKLPTEDHQQLLHQINRVKMQMAPGEDPANVSTAAAIKILLNHLVPISDDRLIIH